MEPITRAPGQGRVALVTWGEQRHRVYLAEGLAEDGYHVALIARSAARLESVCADVRARYGVRAAYRAVDVTNKVGLQQAINELVQELGGKLDVVVVNAGLHAYMSALQADGVGSHHEQLMRVLDVNLTAAINTALFALRHLVAPPRPEHAGGNFTGYIIFVNSLIAKSKGSPSLSTYQASKYGLEGFAASLFEDVNQLGVKVSSLFPGLVSTDLVSDIASNFERTGFGDISPSDMLQPSDIVAAMRFLLGSARQSNFLEIVMQHHREPSIDYREINKPLTVDLRLHKPLGAPENPNVAFIGAAPENPNVAFITGASKGIGHAIALTLAARGYNLALVARSHGPLYELADRCVHVAAANGHHVQVMPEVLDVCNTPALEDAIHECARRFGTISVLINNAGINRRRSAAAASRDVWDLVLDTNLRSAMQATRTVLPYMYHRDKSLPQPAVIFISSIAQHASFRGEPGIAPYYMTKKGLWGLAETAWLDVREKGIKISCICPGLVNTELGVRKGPVEVLAGAAQIPVNDIARAVEFVLASSATACPTEIVVTTQHPKT
eukprot:CAMPEP_0177678824 /NCGR_PEP_ID=MMETSP0447-20121125/29222_1 /TAXON_ID=0 /ORGANISM="Stygamoeba regulata, Strain BSH-02190019" /LENGTH=555 /DNA_ID=CAMNT_0019187867 /DNA_START=85 /DNA_END=1750 /DNA_ORIENTATION=-